jgi:myo-inositol-1(or 4)-monophosphatase
VDVALPTLEVLEAVARRAGTLALGHFRHAAAERKADRSLVTAADREVEAFLVAELGRLLPEAGIIAEEGGRREGRGPYRIVIDPIDGTGAFVAGLAGWCVCVAIMRAAETVAGVVHLPCTGETYTASGDGAWWNGEALRPLGASPAGIDPFVTIDGKTHTRRRITYPGKIRSLGSGAYHVVLVARGAAEAALLGRVHLWDLAAPGALLHAVGGRYEYLTGDPVDLASLVDGRRAPGEIIAGAPAAIARLRPLLGGA